MGGGKPGGEIGSRAPTLGEAIFNRRIDVQLPKGREYTVEVAEKHAKKAPPTNEDASLQKARKRIAEREKELREGELGYDRPIPQREKTRAEIEKKSAERVARAAALQSFPEESAEQLSRAAFELEEDTVQEGYRPGREDKEIAGAWINDQTRKVKVLFADTIARFNKLMRDPQLELARGFLRGMRDAREMLGVKTARTDENAAKEKRREEKIQEFDKFLALAKKALAEGKLIAEEGASKEKAAVPADEEHAYVPTRYDRAIAGGWVGDRTRNPEELFKDTVERYNELVEENPEWARGFLRGMHREARAKLVAKLEGRRRDSRVSALRAERLKGLEAFLDVAERALAENKPIVRYEKAPPASADAELPRAGEEVRASGAMVKTAPAEKKGAESGSEEHPPSEPSQYIHLLTQAIIDQGGADAVRGHQTYIALLAAFKKCTNEDARGAFLKQQEDRIIDSRISQRKRIAIDLFLRDHEKSGEISSIARTLQETVPLLEAHVEKAFRWSGAEASRARTHRDGENQDTPYLDADAGIGAVFDGMGGMGQGENAGSEASSAARDGLAAHKDALVSAKTRDEVRNALQDIFADIRERMAHLAYKGDTTATIGKIVREDGKHMLMVGNIGDSRAYVYRAREKKLDQITRDDDVLGYVSAQSPLHPFIDEIRQLLSEAAHPDMLYSEDSIAKYFPDSPLARQGALARVNELIRADPHMVFLKKKINSIEDLFGRRNAVSKSCGNSNPSWYAVPLEEGDTVLYTSDGIHDNVTNGEIAELLEQMRGKSDEEIADAVLARAAQISESSVMRSKPDDMTVVVLTGAEETHSKASSPAAETAPAPIEKTGAYRELLAQYTVAQSNKAAREAFVAGLEAEVRDTKIDTERTRAERLFLEHIRAGAFDAKEVVAGDARYARMRNLKEDTEAKQEIKKGDIFNIKAAHKSLASGGTGQFIVYGEIADYRGKQIRVYLTPLGDRALEEGAVYTVRIKEVDKKSKDGRYYFNTSEVIGPNCKKGDVFTSKISENPDLKNPKVMRYSSVAPDGLHVAVSKPDHFDPLKDYRIEITTAADMQSDVGIRNHFGVEASEIGAASPSFFEMLAPEKQAELARDRELFMQIFPEGIVTRGIMERDEETGEPVFVHRGNLDAESCIFLLQRFFNLPEEYAHNEKNYVEPGEYRPNALNVDTGFDTTGFQIKWFSKKELAEQGMQAPEASDTEIAGQKIPQKEEDKGGAHVVIVQDHGPDANRTLSAFKLLYFAIIDRYGEEAIPPAEREPIKKYVQFVTHIDNYTAPRVDFDWKKAWEESDKIPFMLALAKQNYLYADELYQFFQRHPLEDAFKRPSQWAVDAVPLKNGRYNFRGEAAALERAGFNVPGREHKDGRQESIASEQFKIIERGERYFDYLLHNESEFVAESKSYGRILVVLDADHAPGRLSAAMAHGIDGMLEWRPGTKSFWFNVAPQKDPGEYGTPQIPHALAEDTGGVWVRGSIVIQPEWKKEELKAGLKLGVFLDKIGVQLDAIQGRLKERVDAESKGEKPWERVPKDKDFLALKAELKKEIEKNAPAVTVTDPNARTVNGYTESYYLELPALKRSDRFKDYSMNIWVMAVHEWFNDQIMETLRAWMESNIAVTGVNQASHTIVESGGVSLDKQAFMERHEQLPPEYSTCSKGLWKGALEKWFDARVNDAIRVPDLVGETLAREETRRLEKEQGERRAREEADRQEAERLAQEKAEKQEAERIAQEEAARIAEEKQRIEDARRALQEATDRLARAEVAKDQYEGIVGKFKGFISGKGNAVENEYRDAKAHYHEVFETSVVPLFERALEWRTALVDARLQAFSAREKGFGEKIVGVWKKFGEASVGHILEKKGFWKDKRGWGWKGLEIFSKSVLNARTLATAALGVGGWFLAGTAAGATMAGLGAGASSMTGSIGYYEMLKQGYRAGQTTGEEKRARVFKDQAEAEVHYQAEYASAGRFRRFWKRMTGQGGDAEAAAAHAVWLSDIGKEAGTGQVNLETKRKALAERMLAFEADAILQSRHEYASDPSYQALKSEYAEVLRAQEAILTTDFAQYFDRGNQEFVDGLARVMQEEKKAYTKRKIAATVAGFATGLAAAWNRLEGDNYYKYFGGTEGKPPAPPEEIIYYPQADKFPEAVEQVKAMQHMDRAPSVSVTPTGTHDIIAPSAPHRTIEAQAIDLFKGETAWQGVRNIDGTLATHVVQQKGHRALELAARAIIHEDPERFGWHGPPTGARFEHWATERAIAFDKQQGLLFKGGSVGVKFDANHPVVVTADESGTMRILNWDKAHMGVVDKRGVVMHGPRAQKLIDHAYERISQNAQTTPEGITETAPHAPENYAPAHHAAALHPASHGVAHAPQVSHVPHGAAIISADTTQTVASATSKGTAKAGEISVIPERAYVSGGGSETARIEQLSSRGGAPQSAEAVTEKVLTEPKIVARIDTVNIIAPAGSVPQDILRIQRIAGMISGDIDRAHKVLREYDTMSLSIDDPDRIDAARALSSAEDKGNDFSEYVRKGGDPGGFAFKPDARLNELYEEEFDGQISMPEAAPSSAPSLDAVDYLHASPKIPVVFDTQKGYIGVWSEDASRVITEKLPKGYISIPRMSNWGKHEIHFTTPRGESVGGDASVQNISGKYKIMFTYMDNQVEKTRKWSDIKKWAP